MIGSSQSIATANTYLNVAAAQVLKEFADKLDHTGNAAKINEAVHALIKESYSRHSRVVFNGNGYINEWEREAESRGLPNVKNAVDALTVLAQGEIVSLFETHNVLSGEEVESRYQIYLEKYSKQLNIEAGVTIDIARRQIFPAVSAYAAELAREASALAAINAVSLPQEKRAGTIAGLAAELYEETDRLETVLGEAQGTEDPFVRAKAYLEKVRPVMDAVRSRADALEKLVAKESWPFPGYEELLFKL